MFDKEVILEYVIKKKNEYSRHLKEYEKLKRKDEEENDIKLSTENDAKVSAFLKSENNIVSKSFAGDLLGINIGFFKY